MYEQALEQIGLSKKEADIYQILLKLDKVPANKILPHTELKRTTVYSVLDELVKKGIIEKDESRGLIEFRAKHPYSLKEYLENKIQQIKTAEQQIEAVLPNFISLYQQAQNRPGVRFYEGKEGVWKTLQATLYSSSEVLTIADIDAIDKYLSEINQKYIKLREKRGIKKRILVVDSPLAKKRYLDRNTELTDVHFVEFNIKNFNSAIEIFDNKIVYITMSDEYLYSILIDDAYLYRMQKTFFDFMWSKAQAAKVSPPLSSGLSNK